MVGGFECWSLVVGAEEAAEADIGVIPFLAKARIVGVGKVEVGGLVRVSREFPTIA